MQELFDYLQKQIGKEDCPIVSIHPVFGVRENYFEVVMKDNTTIKMQEGLAIGRNTIKIDSWIIK